MARIRLPQAPSGREQASAVSDGVQRFSQPVAKAPGRAPLPTAPLSLARPAGVQMVWAGIRNAMWMDRAGEWEANPDMAGRASALEAKNLKLKVDAKGNPVAVGKRSNAARAKPQSWNFLRANKLSHPKGPPNYVRMHFLNGRMGGPGNDVDNLAPGSGSLNGKHSWDFEKHVWGALRNGDTINSFKIQATYQAGGGALTAPAKTAFRDTLAKLECEATHTPAGAAKGAKPQNLKKVTVNETANLDKAANWKGL